MGLKVRSLIDYRRSEYAYANHRDGDAVVDADSMMTEISNPPASSFYCYQFDPTAAAFAGWMRVVVAK